MAYVTKQFIPKSLLKNSSQAKTSSLASMNNKIDDNNKNTVFTHL